MRCLIPLALAGCAAPLDEVETLTEGGSYRVTLERIPREVGPQLLPLRVAPGTGELMEALVSMPSMGHGEQAPIEPVEEGLYEVEADLSMRGWWVLDGVVEGEDFRIEFEIL